MAIPTEKKLRPPSNAGAEIFIPKTEKSSEPVEESALPPATEIIETEKAVEAETPAEKKQPRGAMERAIERLTPGKKSKKIPMIPRTKDDLTISVERIMQENLESAYAALSPVEQQEFKIKGEATALEIRNLLERTSVKIKKIFLLIFRWLSFLPGVNRFYLEQEAKIKADKILSLKYFVKKE